MLLHCHLVKHTLFNIIYRGDVPKKFTRILCILTFILFILNYTMITVRELEQNKDAGASKADRIVEQTAVDSSKLAIIHVVSSTQTVSMTPLRKISVLKNIFASDGIINKDIKCEPLTEEIPEVYQQRKRMVLEYKELFAALMKLPDKEMQKKLLDVINNHHQVEHRTVETQTDPVEFKLLEIDQKSEEVDEDASNSVESENSLLKVRKRKRKRKVSLPQANKESRAKQLAQMNKPKTAKGNSYSPTVKEEPQNINLTKRSRFDSISISECCSDVVNIYEDTETNLTNEIQQCTFLLENGLLPIQDAVVRNQIIKLNIHIRIWQKYKLVDLNDILTEEDEDLLQLAILNTCDPSIMNLLLQEGLNPNTLDADSNTVLHLAVLNDITAASLEQLMKHIDLKLLLTLNDDGYTPLHLAVRQDRYLLAERLINVLDERLVKKPFYKRPVDELETDETVLKKQFKDFYEKVCIQMAVDEETDECAVGNDILKQKLLQAGDRKSGNTSLYFAIDNRFEHLIYFLLAHLTDPRTENLSGIDCKTYFCEFGKSLNLSLNIDNTMEKVIKLLS